MKVIPRATHPFTATFSQASITTRPRSRCSYIQRRTFLPNPFGASIQNLTASRVLPYPSKVIYEVITDVASYKHFIPYCLSSEVLKYSNPTEDGKTWPEEAKLLVGFGGDISETFWSRIYCVPETIVETVAGRTDTSLPADQIAHHNPRLPADQDPVRKGNVMKHLSTKWTLRPRPEQKDATEIHLKINYEFANPLYSALSTAASGKVADKMIEAFEKRVKAVVDNR